MAYDERYAKANKSIDETPQKSGTRSEAWSIMDSIQKSAPYVDFLPDSLLGSLKAEVQAYFRRGGRVLSADFYRKGVKTSDADYEWDGNLWITRYHTTNPEATIQTTKTFQLSIELSTLRYIEQVTITDTAGSGETIATRSDTVDSELGSGTCERIPAKPN